MMDEFGCYFACESLSRDRPDSPKANAAIKRAIEENIRQQEEIQASIQGEVSSLVDYEESKKSC